MKTKIKFLGSLFTMAMLLALLPACSPTSEQAPTNTPGGDTRKEPEHIATLVADMSFGSGHDDLISRYEYGYDGSLTVEIMAQGLSELTGLNYAINDSVSDSGSVSVDWSPDATFIAGLGDTPQKDAFFVYDSESLTWFMLNSMYRTLLENDGTIAEVYYSMDGGSPMMNEVFAPHGFPVDMAYTGSHEGRGDDFAEQGINWLGEYKNADETKALIISHFAINREGIPYFNFLLTTTDGKEFDGLAAFDPDEESDLAHYMDLTFAMGIDGDDVTVWQDEPYDDGHEREIFVDTYFRTNSEENDGELPYWNGFDFGPNLEYAEEYIVQGDPGEYLNYAEAAKLIFDTMRDNGNIPEYSDDTQYQMTLIDLTDIEGEECYLYRLDVDEPTGTIGAAYTYAYQSGNIYMQGYGGQWVRPVGLQ